jgi:hypothetical protein
MPAEDLTRIAIAEDLEVGLLVEGSSEEECLQDLFNSLSWEAYINPLNLLTKLHNKHKISYSEDCREINIFKTYLKRDL